MDKTSKKGLAVLILVGLAAILLGLYKLNFTQKNTWEDSNSFSSKSLSPKKFNFRANSKPYIAVLHINGVIQEANQTYNQDWLLNTIRTLKNDDKNLGILLYIDSPGGTVYHADEAYLTLLDYKTTGKSVYAYFGPMAASGGYYIGCAADKIYANRNGLTGSIGVISASFVDATGLLEKLGLKSMTIHAGKNKNMLNFNESATDEQIAIMQSLADECYEQFTQIVSLSRKMKIEYVKTLADGRVYSALQAKENGLIDDVVSIGKAKELIRTDFNDNSLLFKNYKYDRPESLRSLLMESFSFIKNPQSAYNGGNILFYM